MEIKFFDGPVNIKQVRLGEVVQLTDFVHTSNGVHVKTAIDVYGHITGFSKNSTDELVLLVSVTSATVVRHPSNLIFKIQ